MDEASDVATNQEAKLSNENESKPEEVEVKDDKTEVGEEKSETAANEVKSPESGDAVTASAADASEALVAKSVENEAKNESGELKDEVVKEINVHANEKTVETGKSEIKDESKETTASEEKSPENDNADIASVIKTSEAKPSEVKAEMEPGELKGEVVMEVDADANKDGKEKHIDNEGEEKQSECMENKQDQVQSTEQPAKEEEASTPTVQSEPDLLSQVALPEQTPPPPVVISTSSDVPMAVEKKEDPDASASTLAKPAESKRRGSIEKMSNFLRQFRSSGGFTKFTASQFMKVWNHYDSDGNGFIADNELDGFLREFVLSSVGENEVRPEILSESAMAIFKETFMDAFDENQDGMIDIAELAEILPTDENFLLLFHLKNPVESSVEFMKIWREYDKDCKGYIESTELKSFLKHILDNQKTSVSDEKLDEYTETILNLFDSNRDGKLQLCEMARLMPVKQNFLSKPILKGASCITRSDIDRLFKIYDQNRNGTIEDEELSGLLKDLMDLGKKDYTLNDIENMKKVIMDHWDTDQDGTISKSELRMFLIQQCKLSAESQGLEYDDEGDDYDSDFD